MSFNKGVRQTHRWLSIIFTLTVIANFATMLGPFLSSNFTVDLAQTDRKLFQQVDACFDSLCSESKLLDETNSTTTTTSQRTPCLSTATLGSTLAE